MEKVGLYLDVRGTLHHVPSLFHYLFLMAWSCIVLKNHIFCVMILLLIICFSFA